MNLIRFHNPANTLSDMLDDYYFRTCNCGNNTDTPAVNIKENDNNYTLDMAIPGMEKNDFTIDVENNTLTITSDKTTENQENNTKENYTRREFMTTSFSRSFTLPKTVNMEAITADYKNGILTVTMPKLETEKMRQNRKVLVS